jgi:dihydrofolate reductase
MNRMGVAALARQPGQDLVLYGGHDLVHSLLEHDLIDEYTTSLTSIGS